MDRDDLAELHCIQPIDNLGSIAELGILCHNLARGLDHADISDGMIQDLRDGKKVPHAAGEGMELHDYANLYVCARNPMMFVRRHLHTGLAVLRVSCDVLDLDGVLVTDGNAASRYSRFGEPTAGLAAIDAEVTFLGDPRHSNTFEFYDRKRRQCAEVLVPERVPPEFITGTYVSCDAAHQRIGAMGLPWGAVVAPRIFFQ